MERPRTRYARSGEFAIAYQVHGSGDHDILWGAGPFSNVDTILDVPEAARFFERLGQFARVIRYDRRDSGLSDPVRDDLALEAHAYDALAVMDAAESQRPWLVGAQEGSRGQALVAAMHPERVAGLWAFTPTVGPPTVTAPEAAATFARELAQLHWPDAIVNIAAPDWAPDPARNAVLARYFCSCATPRQAERTLRMMVEGNVADALPLVQAPALVVRPRDLELIPYEAVKAFADAIPGAVYQEIPGNAASPWVLDVELLADIIEEFVTGTKPRRVSNRVLATVLFTDLVDSTRRAAELGDREWTRLLDRHLDSVRATIAAFDGQVVKPTGDGVLALLAGPAQAVRCAESVIADAQVLGLQVRTGVHTGEIDRTGDDVAGVGVHLAARITDAAQAGEVLVSRTVRDLAIGSELAFADRGEHELKGIPDRWTLYAASSGQP